MPGELLHPPPTYKKIHLPHLPTYPPLPRSSHSPKKRNIASKKRLNRLPNPLLQYHQILPHRSTPSPLIGLPNPLIKGSLPKINHPLKPLPNPSHALNQILSSNVTNSSPATQPNHPDKSLPNPLLQGYQTIPIQPIPNLFFYRRSPVLPLKAMP